MISLAIPICYKCLKTEFDNWIEKLVTRRLSMGDDYEMKKNNNLPEKSTMRCIICPDCGQEILMVPTLTKMVEAIKNHVSTHRGQSKDEIEDEIIRPVKLSSNLTEQVLEEASKMLTQSPPLWFVQDQ
jgi:hypothetical protein